MHLDLYQIASVERQQQQEELAGDSCSKEGSRPVWKVQCVADLLWSFKCYRDVTFFSPFDGNIWRGTRVLAH